MSRRCTKCDKEPSGYIPRAHEFCEFCGERLPVIEPERVTAKCYRCGRPFETVAGVTMCADCQQLPSVGTAPLPDEPQNNFVMAALWGAALPITVRVAYGFFAEGAPSREAKALTGLIAFTVAVALLATLGLVTGQTGKHQSASEQAIAWATAAATVAALWALT